MLHPSQNNQDHDTDLDRGTLEADLRLSMVSGVGPRLRVNLIERFGSVQDVFLATKDQLCAVPGIGSRLASAIDLARHIDIDQELSLCTEHDVSLIPLGADDYPRLLSEIHDPPSPIFVRGTMLASDSLSIAIVGTRHATQYGKRQAHRLASSLARAGLTIISGLARGIDTVAHRAALDAGGRTIAVLAGGLMDVFPSENQSLSDEVSAQGALLSEMPMRSQPAKGAFPRRNRLITGLSLGVIVVEAPSHSGAMISARHAMEQGREVFAVPGPVDARTSRGCHQLLRDGARLVESAEDVLGELGPLFEPTHSDGGQLVLHPAELQLNEQEQTVLNCIDCQSTSIDAIVDKSKLPVHRVLSTISVLEMRHLIQRSSGSHVMRCPNRFSG